VAIPRRLIPYCELLRRGAKIKALRKDRFNLTLSVRIAFVVAFLVAAILIGPLFARTRPAGPFPVENTVTPTMAAQPIAISATPTGLGIQPMPTNTSLFPQSDSGFSLVPTNTSIPTSIPPVMVNTLVPPGTPLVPANTPGTMPSATALVTANTRIPRGSHSGTTNTVIPPGTPLAPANTLIPAQTASLEQFIRTYFDAINSRNYEYTWSLLSDAFIASHNGPEKAAIRATWISGTAWIVWKSWKSGSLNKTVNLQKLSWLRTITTKTASPRPVRATFTLSTM
jgi:hypothetical protein